MSAVGDPLDTYPRAKRERYRARKEKAALGRLRASIDLKCLDCVSWSAVEVKRCAIRSCSLWLVRPFQAKL